MNEVVERAREQVGHVDRALTDMVTEIERLEANADRLRAGIFHIMAVTRDGKVCDDVAWFSDHETLWDHCAWLVGWEKDQAEPLPTDPPTDADREYVNQIAERTPKTGCETAAQQEMPKTGARDRDDKGTEKSARHDQYFEVEIRETYTVEVSASDDKEAGQKALAKHEVRGKGGDAMPEVICVYGPDA